MPGGAVAAMTFTLAIGIAAGPLPRTNTGIGAEPFAAYPTGT
jgi:hypothetical protein